MRTLSLAALATTPRPSVRAAEMKLDEASRKIVGAADRPPLFDVVQEPAEPPPPPKPKRVIPADFEGLVEDLPADEYHADPCERPSLSASIAKVLDRSSPLHAWAAHPRFGGRAPVRESKALARGTLLHALLLGESDRIEVVHADDWRTKAAKAARADANAWGRIPTLVGDLERTQVVADAITERLDELGLVLERDAADPDGAAAAAATLAGALDDVLIEYEARAREGRNARATVEFYRKRGGQLLRMIAEGALPARLSALRAHHVDAMIDRRRAEGSSPSTISKDLIVLRLALKLAKRRGQWTGDVDAVLPHRFSPEYKPRERTLAPAELWALLAELRPGRAAWVAFAVATGANLSETQRARAEDVRIEHAWRTPQVHLRGTKRELRDRHVPVFLFWQRALLEAVWSTSVQRSGALFAPWMNVNRELRAACARAGLAPVSTNDLRRTFGTWARASGVPLELLGPAMGHVDSRMVERVYARLDVSQLAALLAPRVAVPDLYIDPAHGAHKAHSAERLRPADPLKTADSGSDCWTRTSDPVINSHRAEPMISDACGAECAEDVHELRGLVKASRHLSSLWDVLEMGEEDVS